MLCCTGVGCCTAVVVLVDEKCCSVGCCCSVVDETCCCGVVLVVGVDTTTIDSCPSLDIYKQIGFHCHKHKELGAGRIRFILIVLAKLGSVNCATN